MSYTKKDQYPIIHKSGIYPDGNDKEIGLDNDSLEKYSLGNWNSIVRNNRPFVSNFLTKYSTTFDEEEEIEEIPISLVPIAPPYSAGDALTGYDEFMLTNRWLVEYYGWYLNTKILHDAGFHAENTVVGSMYVPPTVIDLGGTEVTMEGTFDVVTKILPEDGFMYFKEDVIGTNMVTFLEMDTRDWFNSLNMSIVPPETYDFGYSSGMKAPLDPDGNPISYNPNVEGGWDTIIENGLVSEEYVEAFKSAYKFHNWSYEVHHGINRAGMASTDEQGEINNVYSNWSTVATYQEAKQWSGNQGCRLFNKIANDPQAYDNAFNTLNAASAYIEARTPNNQDHTYPPNNYRRKIKATWADSPSYGSGVPAGRSGDPLVFANPDDSEALSVFENQYDHERYVKRSPTQLDYKLYMETVATTLRNWLIANVFYLEENPIEGDETYGSIEDNNPIKINFGFNNQEELDDILSYHMVTHDVILDEDICNFAPDGLRNMLYSDIAITTPAKEIPFSHPHAERGSHPTTATWTNRTACTMRFSPIFDRPKKYYGINKGYLTSEMYLPDEYETDPEIPSQYIIQQHPAGNPKFGISTNGVMWNSDVNPGGSPFEYGHWIGNNPFRQDGHPGLGSDQMYIRSDFYRAASYFTANLVTLEEKNEFIGLEVAGDAEALVFEMMVKPLFLIDDREIQTDSLGRPISTFNVYIANLFENQGIFPQLNWGLNLMDNGENWDARNDHLVNTLGYPNFPWPPVNVSEEEEEEYEFSTIESSFDFFVSTLTTLENNSDLPDNAVNWTNQEKLLLDRDEYTVSKVDFVVNAFYAYDIGNTILKPALSDVIQSNFLYYDEEDSKYLLSSYPIKLNFVIDLYDYPEFTNEQKIIDVDELEEIHLSILSGQTDNDGVGYLKGIITDAAASDENSIYRAQVVQWGDEPVLLDDEALLNTYFFSMYEQEEWPSVFSYGYKKQRDDQINKARPIMEVDTNGNVHYNVFSHNYTSPGTKAIKIMIYRYTPDNLFLIESSLITKNVAINSGLISAQDFSVFGGSDFNFLPLKDKKEIGKTFFPTIYVDLTATTVGTVSTSFDAEIINDLPDFNIHDYLIDNSITTNPNRDDIRVNGSSVTLSGYQYQSSAGPTILTSISINNSSYDGQFEEGSTYTISWSIAKPGLSLLPRPLQAIVGGLSEDSKYHTSVQQIKKDDNFIDEDYLERSSTQNYIKEFERGAYGYWKNELDLGQLRFFSQPRDIYDFITNDKEEIVNNQFNIDTLPINSSVTDIFISDDKNLTIDLNPSNTEYSAIENSAGFNSKGVLIGDYKIDQPKDGKIRKESSMEIPILEVDNEKQAF